MVGQKVVESHGLSEDILLPGWFPKFVLKNFDHEVNSYPCHVYKVFVWACLPHIARSRTDQFNRAGKTFSWLLFVSERLQSGEVGIITYRTFFFLLGYILYSFCWNRLFSYITHELGRGTAIHTSPVTQCHIAAVEEAWSKHWQV